MYQHLQPSNRGMRPLPPEELELDLSIPSLKNKNKPKKNQPKVQPQNPDIRHLTMRIQNFAENETCSDNEALKLIEDTRGTILKLRLLKKDQNLIKRDKKKKRSSRHNSPHTSKKRPPGQN